jgi:hypothetical protein
MRGRWLWSLGRQETLASTTTTLPRPNVAKLCGHGVRSYARIRPAGAGATSVSIFAGDNEQKPTSVEHATVNASSPLTLSVEDRRLLGRARLHGIRSMEDLMFQTHVGSYLGGRRRLVETASRRQDLDLWLFIMQFNKQRRGLQGIATTWWAMFASKPAPVKLDPDNANARDIIDIAIYAGVTEDAAFLREVCLYCLHRYYAFEGLWAAVVGALMQHTPSEALAFANLLRSSFRGAEDLLLLLRSACESKAPDVLYIFLEIDRMLRQRSAHQLSRSFQVFRIYHEAIPYLWQLDRPTEAFILHQHLLAMGDLPQDANVLLPFVGHLAAAGSPVELFLTELENVGVNFTGELRRIYERERRKERGDSFLAINTESENRRRIRDETVARALATSPSSFDFILSPMMLIGNIDFGPLSVRQMVLMSPDIETLKTRFNRLKELGIDTGVSRFTTIIRNLLTQRQFGLIKSLAASDMHHDEFADQKLQRQLLVQYDARGDVGAVKRTLAILQNGRTDVDFSVKSTSIFLDHAIIARDWHRVLDIVISLHQTGGAVHHMTLKLLRDELTLPTSDHRGDPDEPRRPIVPEFDQFAFFFAICQQLLATRTVFQPLYFRFALLRLAQQGRIGLLHKQCRVLIKYFTAPHRETLLKQEIAEIFKPAVQRLLITWDFKYRKWRTQLFPQQPARKFSRAALEGTEPWLAGARLLRMLRDKHGLAIDVAALRLEFVFRLRQLNYSRGRYSVTSNRKFALMRGYTYRDLLEGWLRVWREKPSNSAATILEDSNKTSISSNNDSDHNSNLDKEAPTAAPIQRNTRQEEAWIQEVLAILRRETFQMRHGISIRAHRDGTPTTRKFAQPRPSARGRYLATGSRAGGLLRLVGGSGDAAEQESGEKVDLLARAAEGKEEVALVDSDDIFARVVGEVARDGAGAAAKTEAGKDVDIFAPAAQGGEGGTLTGGTSDGKSQV